MVKALKKGDTIGIAAPSSPFDKNQFKKGVSVLKKMGFEVWYRDDIFSQERYLAGSDVRRAEELMELFAKREIKAIFFARGGYGSQRIIPHLKETILPKHKKPVVGLSDVTALLIFLRQSFGIPTFYGPVVRQLGNHPTERTLKSLQQNLMESKPACSDLNNCVVLQDGLAKGPLVGGCLSIITSSIGTPYDLDTRNAILFFEDTGEKVYAVDRMLTQLKNAGKLNGVSGIVVGSLQPKEEEVRAMDSMLKDILQNFKGPIVLQFPAGHSRDFVTLPLGAKATLDTMKKELKFEESLLQ